MNITINGLMPVPLRDKLIAKPSGVWNQKLEFNSGHQVKIKAPSGTGKTTFIHILYKLRNDYTGSVTWDGQDLSTIKNNELADARQKRLSIIFQDMRLFANLTARENIELNRVLTSPYCSAAALDEMAERLGIAHILDQKAGICSYGEQQRIAIIRALMQDFKWLIMDEPFSHLDIENTIKAADLIQESCTKRQAGFIITDLDEDTHFNYTHYYDL